MDTKDDTELRLTPTQDLILDVLAARYRLGETLWTFDSKTSQAILGLERLGLVNSIKGTVNKTIRASLTHKGKELVLDSDYVSPFMAEINSLKESLENAEMFSSSLRSKISIIESQVDEKVTKKITEKKMTRKKHLRKKLEKSQRKTRMITK